MKLSKYGLLLTVLPLLFLTVSCSNSADIHIQGDSSSVSAAAQSVSGSAAAIEQPWLENKPVSVSIVSDIIPEVIISDSVTIENILALVGNLTCYETSSEVIMGDIQL